ADVSGASPSGAVRFALDGLPIGDPLTLGPTGATLEWSPPGGRLTAGAHVVQATYGGDQDDEGSTGSAIAHVSPALTTTTLTSAANPAAAGQPLSWTASVQIAGPGPARPAGAVGFVVDG